MYYAPYFNDDWKVSRRLTLNLGVRYDLLTPQYEKWNRQNGPFDPTIASPIASQVMANVAALGSQIPAAYQSLIQQPRQSEGRPHALPAWAALGHTPWSAYKNNFQPRVGIAYQINDKLVMRCGFGEYYSNPTNDYQQTNGFSTSTTLVNSLDGGRTPIANILSNPYPNGILVPHRRPRPALPRSWDETRAGSITGFVVPSVW